MQGRPKTWRRRLLARPRSIVGLARSRAEQEGRLRSPEDREDEALIEGPRGPVVPELPPATQAARERGDEGEVCETMRLHPPRPPPRLHGETRSYLVTE